MSNNLDIASMALSTLPYEDLDPSIERKIKHLISQNIVFLTSAGNFGPLCNTMNKISRIHGVITVGSTNFEGTKLLDFSSRGIPNSELNPTVVTFGENLYVKCEEKNYSNNCKDIEEYFQIVTGLKKNISIKDALYYKKICGTSFSMPIVAGYIARLLDIRKALKLPYTPFLIKDIIKTIAKPIPGYQEYEVGGGFISNKIIDEYFQNIDKSMFPNIYWGEYKCLKDMWRDARGGGLNPTKYLSKSELKELYT